MTITIKQRLIIVVCLCVLLIGLMVYEVVRTENMKHKSMEVCVEPGPRQCFCTTGRGTSPFFIEEDK